MSAQDMYLKRIKPQYTVDAQGKVNWTPGYTDFNANLYPRGTQLTNEEFIRLLTKQATLNNYNSDSLAELINSRLSTIIRRQVTNDFDLKTSYVKVFTSSDWGEKHEDGYYYITIPASEHGFIKSGTDTNSIDITVQMCLLDEDTDKFFNVTQLDITADNTVTLYTDDNTLIGFAVIGLNSKAYQVAEVRIDASQIDGLANVALSGSYKDLVNTPDATINVNTQNIADILDGTIAVEKANYASVATYANNLSENATIQGIQVSNIFETGSARVKYASQAIQADRANYADADTSKGTIETRLAPLTGYDTSKGTVENRLTNAEKPITQIYSKTFIVLSGSTFEDSISFTKPTSNILYVQIRHGSLITSTMPCLFAENATAGMCSFYIDTTILVVINFNMSKVTVSTGSDRSETLGLSIFA